MIWLIWISLSLAGTLTLGMPNGQLQTKVENSIHIASANEAGTPRTIAPSVYVNGKRVTPTGLVKNGTWAYRFPGPDKEGLLSIRAEIDDEKREWNLPVEPIDVPRFSADSVRVRSKDRRVQMVIRGADVPSPEALEVILSEGRVLTVQAKGDVVLVDVELGDRKVARRVWVALRDQRKRLRPVFSTIEVSQEIRMEYQAESGSSLWVQVGRRRMGPFLEKEGTVSAVFEQHFGDWEAQVEIEDDLGNRSRANERLPKPEGLDVLFIPVETLSAYTNSVDVYVLVKPQRQGSRTPSDVTCQTPRTGMLKMVPVGKDLWHTRVHLTDDSVMSLPIRCDVSGTSHSTRIASPLGVARQIRVRAYPEQISTDFPLSDIQAKVEDAYGTPLKIASLRLRAERGKLTAQAGGENVRTWEYMGSGSAVQAGSDELSATYSYPTGNGYLSSLLLGHDFVPDREEMVVYGRALDAKGLPLSGVSVHLSAGDSASVATTDEHGWAFAKVSVPEGKNPIVAVVQTEFLQRQMVLFRGEGRSVHHPTQADLSEDVELTFRIGRISRIAVDLDPPVLYASNGAEARVRVRFMDAAGNLVPDEFPILEASEGTFGSIVSAGEGVYETTYQPVDSSRSRLVQITARSPSGRTSLVRSLAIEPEPVGRSLSVSFGGLSNFGRVNTLMGGVTFRQRLDLWERRLMLQVGLLGWSQTAEVAASSAIESDYFTRLTLVPIHFGLVARQEWGMVAGSLGLSGVLAPGVSFERFGQDAGYSKVLFLPPGFRATTGVSYRLNVGEVFGELSGVFLYRPGGQGGLQKQVGGMVFLVGYRFILD